MLKEKFLRTYSNVPIALRDDIILVLEDVGPISWYAVYLEVKNDSELSQKILTSLNELEII